MKIWTVDCFTSEIFSGNPAAVTILENFPSDKLCQKIAAEMNLSETAFVKKLRDNHFHIKWFTPSVEVELCGHATLAAAHIIYQENFSTTEAIIFESLSGSLKVYRKNDDLTLDFPLQVTGPNIDLGKPIETALGCRASSIVQAYDDILVEVPSLNELKIMEPNFAKLTQFNCRGVIVTAVGDKRYDFYSRFFAPKVGVDEDPVTGSAHCKLADYWHRKTGKKSFKAFQASKRGGEMQIKIVGDRVHLTGRAVTVLEGKINL
jgi:PhzF family phenazine biosynthesis protein